MKCFTRKTRTAIQWPVIVFITFLIMLQLFFSVCDVFAHGRQRFLFQSTRIMMEFTSTTRTHGLLITFPTTKKLSTSSKITKGTLLLLLEVNVTAAHRMSVVVLK